MLLLRSIATLAVPSSVALVAFLHAHAIGSLIDATMMPASSVAPFAEARAAGAAPTVRSAAPILDRNPFDHRTRSLRPNVDDDAIVPECDGVRATIAVHGGDQDGSLAAFVARGEHLLRRRGGDVFDMRVLYVGTDRVWLSQNGVICQTRVFGG